jgi:putative addiction module killer protein
MEKQIRKTDTFNKWFEDLKDQKAKAIINVRIRRASLGNLGDVEPVGEGVSELKIHYGPGYRVYIKEDGEFIVILLCGGIKNSQKRDIKKAKEIANNLE